MSVFKNISGILTVIIKKLKRSNLREIFLSEYTVKLGYNELGCLRTLGYNEQFF
jgi:hypothetical protein